MKFMMMLVFMFLVACQTPTTIDGQPVSQPPPSPLEAKLLAKSIFGLSLYAADLDQAKLIKLQAALEAGKGTMALALAKDPTSFESSSQGFLDGLDPVFQDMVHDLMQVFVLRMRPYINQDHQDTILIEEYVRSVLDGALASTTLMISRGRETLVIPLDTEDKRKNTSGAPTHEVGPRIKQLGHDLGG